MKIIKKIILQKALYLFALVFFCLNLREYSLFALIRLLAAIVLGFILMAIIKEVFQLNSKFNLVFLFTGIFAIQIALGFIPFENAFVRFSTPEDIWKYKNTAVLENKDDAGCLRIIDGTQSTLFTYVENSKMTFEVFSKSPDGWKLTNDRIEFKVVNSVTAVDTVYWCTARGSGEYFVIVFCFEPNTKISDSIGSNFKTISLWGDAQYSITYSYFAVVPATEQYELTLDDQKVDLDLK